MPLTFRATKGTPLTSAEADENIRTLAGVLPTTTPNTYAGPCAPQRFTAYNSPTATGYTAGSIQDGGLLNVVSGSSDIRPAYPLRSDLIDGVRRAAGVMFTGTGGARTPNVFCQRFAILHTDFGTLDARAGSLTFNIRKASDSAVVVSRVFNKAISGPDIPAGGPTYEVPNTIVYAPEYGLYFLEIVKGGTGPIGMTDVYAY